MEQGFMTDLRGKRVLVTGGGTRLGREFSLALGNIGCRVAIHYHQNRSGAESTAKEIQSAGGEAVLFQADFRDSDAPNALAAAVLKTFGGLDILINNASTWPSREAIKSTGGLTNETTSDFDTAMAVNCRAPFFLMQMFAAALKESQGSVINILDQAATFPYLSRASYSVSKSALLSASKIAARTLGPGIRVNCLEFGPMLPPEEMPPEEVSRISWGGSESAVNGLLFLLLNRFVNGETISIRGSTHLRKQI